MHTDIVADYLRNPRNAGTLSCPDGRGHAVDPDRHDAVTIELRVELISETVAEARFQSQGNPVLAAVAGVATDLIRGRHVDEAAAVTALRINTALGTLPPEDRYCLALCEEAIHNAIVDYVHNAIARLACDKPPTTSS